jgi:hypothetical protein
MRNLFLFVFIFSCIGALAQAPDTAVIKGLELKMKTAVLQGDTTTFFELFAPEAVVNNPANHVATLEMVKKFTRAFEISYSSYDVITEKIVIVENVAISMGKEVVVPKDNANHVGKTVTRRFTDIWMKRNGSWKLIGRQATEVAVQ